MDQTKPSTVSAVFKALQKIDAQFRLLDALLALTHSEHYQSKEFKELRHNDLTYMKDSEAIITYLQEYAYEATGLAKATDYLPYHLEKTSHMVETMVKAIHQLKLEPTLIPLHRTLKKVDVLIRLYKARTVKSHIPQPLLAASAAVPSQGEERSKEIALLRQDNKQLSELVQLTRIELTTARDEIKSLQSKLDQVLQLLLAKQK